MRQHRGPETDGHDEVCLVIVPAECEESCVWKSHCPVCVATLLRGLEPHQIVLARPSEVGALLQQPGIVQIGEQILQDSCVCAYLSDKVCCVEISAKSKVGHVHNDGLGPFRVQANFGKQV